MELARGTKSGPVNLLPPAEPCLDRLVGMKGGSGEQKSWGGGGGGGGRDVGVSLCSRTNVGFNYV